MTAAVRYARSGDVTIAYAVHGDGPVDLVVLVGMLSHVEAMYDEPGIRRLHDRYAEFARVITVDRRGLGMSDPIERVVPLADEVDDLAAVLDDLEVDRAAILGYTAGGAYAVQFAAKFPERTQALVLYASFARTIRTDDIPWAETAEERDRRYERLLAQWGQGTQVDLVAPSAAGDPKMREWYGRLERMSASPGQMRVLQRALAAIDVRDLLPTLRVPTLVLHRTGDRMVDVRHGRYLAERIPGARLVELPGEDLLPSLGDTDAFVGELEEFLTGARRRTPPDRELLTVMFTDIVGGTARAAEIGDRRWRDLLAGHDEEVRRQLERFGGKEVKTIGDGFLAVFAGPPSSAVRCACAIAEATAELGIDVRAGLHTGECEVIGDDVGGMAVHIAARVCALAGARQVVVSGTTYGTIVGSGIHFDDTGLHELRGVPGRWPVYRFRA